MKYSAYQDTFEGISAGLAFVIAGFFILKVGLYTINTYRLMADTSCSKIRAMGLGEVSATEKRIVAFTQLIKENSTKLSELIREV